MQPLKFTLGLKRIFNAKNPSSPEVARELRVMRVALRFALVAPLIVCLTGCLNFLGGGGSEDSVAPGDRQLPASTQALLAIKGMKVESPIFVRIFKEESEFEVWKYKDGRFQHFRTYPICAWSGELGPKVQQGDRQAPEGFYTVSHSQMNPHSLYHLAFNIGFPNTYDQANGHSGSALMVHGNCKSAGCYAMTDAYIEEIYILAREAFNAGQTKFHVQAFPFRMTTWNMMRHRLNEWYPFWVKLKEGYDAFEETGKPPIVKVCGKQYLVNVSFPGGDPAPSAPCPMYTKLNPSQMPGIDGVPQTVLASLNKGETPSRQPKEAPAPVAMASAVPQPAPSKPQPSVAEMVDTSASPVVTRPAAPSQVAGLQSTKAPASPTYASAPKPAASAPLPAPIRVAASTSPVQPVTYRFGETIAAPSEEPSKAIDPDAIQKPNRSGKGGKLGGSSSETTDTQH
jgi:murein L,D-transpeptidase YafK